MLKVSNKQGAMNQTNTDMDFVIADFKLVLVYEVYYCRWKFSVNTTKGTSFASSSNF